MFLMLMVGLSLIATSAVLVMRSFSLAHTARRRTLDQIAVYGFRSDVPADNDESPDLRNAFGGLATATGEKALARFDRLRAGASVTASSSSATATRRKKLTPCPSCKPFCSIAGIGPAFSWRASRS
jgi:hypothetical protein